MSKTLDVRLPKRIAGVKIPKRDRKGPILDFLNSSGGQVVVAEALLLAARSYASKHVSPQSPLDHGGKSSGEEGQGSCASGKAKAKDVGNGAPAASAQLAHAFDEAMRAFRAALNAPMQRAHAATIDDDVAPARVEPLEPELQKKKGASHVAPAERGALAQRATAVGVVNSTPTPREGSVVASWRRSADGR